MRWDDPSEWVEESTQELDALDAWRDRERDDCMAHYREWRSGKLEEALQRLCGLSRHLLRKEVAAVDRMPAHIVAI